MHDPLPEVQPRTKKILFIILAAALAVHVVSDIGVYVLKPQSISTTPDPLDYRLAALNILHHGVFSLAPASMHAPELLRTPVYPAIVAVGYLVDGESGLAVIILQSVLLVVMGWLLFRLLCAFRVPDSIALVLTALYLLEPLQWFYSLLTMTETLASFLVLALVTGALVGEGISDRSRAALYGVGIGLLWLEKPSALMWVPFLLALVLFAEGSWRARFTRVGVALLMCVAVLSPWLIRNYHLTGHLVISSSGPFNLVLSQTTPATAPSWFYKPLATVSYNGHTNEVWYAYSTLAYGKLLAAQKSVLAQTDYASFLGQQLACVPRVWFGFLAPSGQESYGHEYSLIASFAAGANMARDRIINIADTALWTVVLLLAALGSVALFADRAVRWRYVPLLGILLVATFVNLCLAWTRVLLPVYPVIFVAVGAGVAFIARKAHHVSV